MTPPLHHETPIVLFDGVCNLCNGAVQWIVKRDRKAVFCFASLQSEAAQEALRAVGHTTPLPDSLVLIADGAVSVRTAAVL
ncbi:MAG: DCC1-like thiol-disulfide oxidoreductase family protein, partial [Planctomycetota bacterium]